MKAKKAKKKNEPLHIVPCRLCRDYKIKHNVCVYLVEDFI